MEQIKVSVYLPALGVTVDFLLPAHVLVSKLLPPMQKQINAQYGLAQAELPVLLDTNQRGALDPEQDLAAQGVQNGSALMLC